MIALLQRVSSASVTVGGETAGAIGHGLLVFVAVERGDGEAQADRLVDRLMGYRVFTDRTGRMNCSVQDVEGGVLMISQFTLAADTGKGTRPSFTPAAPPEEAERLFGYALERARHYPVKVETGRFGANMQIALVNDGPVTLLLRAEPKGLDD